MAGPAEAKTKALAIGESVWQEREAKERLVEGGLGAAASHGGEEEEEHEEEDGAEG